MGAVMGYLIELKNWWNAINPYFFMWKIARELIRHTQYYKQFNSLHNLFQAINYKIIYNRIYNFNQKKWVQF